MLLIAVVFSSLPLLIGHVLIVKFACRLMSRTQLALKHCIGYSVSIYVASFFIIFLVPPNGSTANVVFFFIVGVGMYLAFGSWYFKKWAKNSTGESIELARAFKLALLILLLQPILIGLLEGASALKRPL
jgi:protein-S-isoprenylcysteine O-methyltransferase Ste14